MIFTVLNILISGFLIYYAIHIDKTAKKNPDMSTNPVVPSILLMGVTAALFTFIYQFNNAIMPSLFTTLMKIVFIAEGCILWNIAFCFPYYSWNYSNNGVSIVKGIGYVLIVLVVLFEFKSIKVSPEYGIKINSAFLFPESARKYFPWTWVTLWDGFLRFLSPAFLCGVMLVRNEMKATKLDRFKGWLYACGLFSMWFTTYAIAVARYEYAAFDLLHFIVYVPMFVIMTRGYNVPAAPGGRGITNFVVKALATYVLPATLMGIIFAVLYPMAKPHLVLFMLCGFAAAGGVLLFVYAINSLVAKSKFGHSSDYAAVFEKDLASVEYTGEMDEIAETMYHIFNKNTEASSMSVYINSGNNTFEPAYSSDGKAHKISEKQNLLESLLNMNKNIVCYSELETLHSLVNIRDELGRFMNDIHGDMIIIINEGRDIHGMIVLGIKESQEHFKEYDIGIFKKLYSYFFVFNYFMRNISNKEVIGTVNRELRMSSQIITSIQENIDILNSPKIDAGCIMVPAHNIGGEFVDMIRLTATRHMFVVGDLSGKGIAASMNMVILKSIIRAYLSETHDFKQLVVKVNSFIRNNLQKGTIFAGMFAILDLEKDTLYYINCGIPAIFLYTQAYANVIEIQGSGHILGFAKDLTPYVQIKSVKLNKNDIVLACTDGLINSHNIRGEEFGKDRIERTIVNNSSYPAARIAKFQHDELIKFMSHEMEDDVSVLVLRVLATAASEKADAEAAKEQMLKQIEEMEKETGFLEGTDLDEKNIPDVLDTEAIPAEQPEEEPAPDVDVIFKEIGSD